MHTSLEKKVFFLRGGASDAPALLASSNEVPTLAIKKFIFL